MAQIIQFPIKALPVCCGLDCGELATCYIELAEASVEGAALTSYIPTVRKYFCDKCAGHLYPPATGLAAE